MSQNSTSRAFMVQQAVLTACGEMFPVSCAEGRLPETLARLGYVEPPFFDNTQLIKLARREFAKIAQQVAA